MLFLFAIKTASLVEEVFNVEHAIKEIDGMINFYSVGMENAKRAKNYEKYYQMEEAYEALKILKNRIKGAV